MPINETYRTWIQRICELRPGQRITQVRNFVWLAVGIYHSRSVQLSQIAGKVLGPAKNLSTVRRLSRFLDNPAIQVREWYEPIARQWLEAQMNWASNQCRAIGSYHSRTCTAGFSRKRLNRRTVLRFFAGPRTLPAI